MSMSAPILFPEDLRSLTKADILRDPELRLALRSLKATLTAAAPAEDIFPKRPLTAQEVARDPELLTALRTVRARTPQEKRRTPPIPPAAALPAAVYNDRPLLRPTSSSLRLRVDGNRLPPGGQYTIASPGPCWMGPHMRMESHRRPKGNLGLDSFCLHKF